MNEKALIYLNNIDTMMQELKIKKPDEAGLSSYVKKLIDQTIIEMSGTLNNIYNVRIESNFLIIETQNPKNVSNEITKLVKNVNVKIKDNLLNKLNLYSDIAKNRALEQTEYVLSEIKKIGEMQGPGLISSTSNNNDIKLDDYINYLKSKLTLSNQEITIESMEKIFDQFNKNISKIEQAQYLEELRNRYTFMGIDNNIQLNRLELRTEELSNVEILENGYILNKQLITSLLPQKLLIAALLGLAISLLFSYLYLVSSKQLLKKKLAFLLYQEK